MNRSMAWNPWKFFFLCIIFFHLAIGKTKGANLPYLALDCSDPRINDNSPHQTNIRTLLSSLSSNATDNANGFYNNTIFGTDFLDTAYGLFMCRGDVLPDACKYCVANATHTLSTDTNCLLSGMGVIWYDECMVRYSNFSFFTRVNRFPARWMCNTATVSSDSSNFMSLLDNTLLEVVTETANSTNRYFTKQENLPDFQTLYCLGQCTQDLSFERCHDCLNHAREDIPTFSSGKQGGRVLYSSCTIRYELYPFYRLTDEGPKGLVPETHYTNRDSEYSQDPGYIFLNCSNNKIDADFISNLRTLLFDLSSNATSKSGFQTQEGTAYGLFRCRIDIDPPHLCEQCIKNATDKITSECGLAYAEAVIWYNHCWLRYSDRNFFSTAETIPRFRNLNISNSSIQYSIASELSNQLAKVANMTGDTDNKFLTDESLKLNDEQTVFILGQCSSDLSSGGCSGCLSDMIGTAIPWRSLGSVGGRVMYPSCILRFELFRFYNLTPPSPSAPPPSPGFSISIHHDSHANKRKDNDIYP
ncbi:hypothetical protein LR48_Vigan03g068300 [Vigna angularis]|uniref:Cysteine-rich receptor-like protein n=1 Tax=Phaseolus angularis TaxID=3914 RepID=A0A0L9U3P3_PHAAN|nr:Cysteine-rich receptor-like protein [Vigna angularis]KOM37302.1 hypothetical protein LR48_Vigan03g068300 [Vigna angularis]